MEDFSKFMQIVSWVCQPFSYLEKALEISTEKRLSHKDSDVS